jgi:DNA repair protein RadC
MIVRRSAARYSRPVQYQRAGIPVTFNGVLAAREFFAKCLAKVDRSRENLWVAHLDAYARCLHLSRHQGDERGVDFPLRDIIVDAAQHGSASILLAHNHRGGDARPSESDLRATRRLATAAEALDCRVLDHLVFAGAECRSLRRLGYL